MRISSKLGFYIFHPIGVPFLAALFYFLVGVRHIPSNFIQAKLLAVSILTIGIPVVFVSSLIQLKIADSVQLTNIQPKRFFLLCLSILLITLNRFVIHDDLPELLYFYTGYLITICVYLFLSLFNINLSLHTGAISALIGFIVGISLLYKINLVHLIGVAFLIVGWIASTRLFSEVHSLAEVIWGFILGLAPQVYFLNLALQHYRM
ncbi:MAG TPA: hypothetical protein VK021_10840 [Flavobacteriaceae bacterium]|nr:hypothetical protein [Flavobacteriaceae bacterium]